MNAVGWLILVFLVIILGFVFIAAYQSGPLISEIPTLPTLPTDPSPTPTQDLGNGATPIDPAKEIFHVRISRGTAQSANEAKKEYIEIRASRSNKNTVNISGWQLENRKGNRMKIPQGTLLAYLSRVNPTRNILLEPGARAVIITGKSPINSSFRLNQCTGYFNQFESFTPPLPQQCPNPKNEAAIESVNDACFQYVRGLPICRMSISIPLETRLAIGNECQNFLSNYVSYAGCVKAHRNDLGFFSNEWRVYLGESEEIWSGVRETIKLLDKDSHLITEISY